jgi:hypothetical protein
MVQVRSHLSRRNMLIGLAGGAAATAGTLATHGFTESASFANLLRPVGLGPSGAPLATAGYADWANQIGSSFTAHSGQVLKLVDVQGFPQKGARPGNLRDRAFVARFDISKGASLSEDLYRVAHPEGGTFDIFLTQDSPDKPLRMLAVFG